MAHPADHSDTSGSDDVVVHLNMPRDDEPVDAGDWPGSPRGANDVATLSDAAPEKRVPLAQALLLGLLAVVVIAVSMFVIMQGVFQMIPD